MYALFHTSFTHICCGNYAAASAEANELVPLADERGSLFWESLGMLVQGCVLALTGKVSDAVHVITSGIIARRSTSATALEPFCLSYLAGAHAELDNFDDALSCIREAMTKVETTKESWFEAEIKRVAGEIALLLPNPDATKAEEYFEDALTVARQQQAKSWELRAAVSMARLWYDQGKRQQGHDLLAPVYAWFTEGFDTPDLKEAKSLLQKFKA
jgi:predicted ATPase